MNPYGILAGIVLELALLYGCYNIGRRVEHGACLEAQAQAQDGFKKQVDAADARATRAAEEAATAKIKLDAARRVRAREVIRYVSSPAAAVACLDDDGLRVWNRDAAPGADPVQPVGPGSGPGELVRPQ